MPNLLRKWKTQDVILSVLLILLVPVTFHCIESPLKPVAPSWTTQLTIPLIDRTYYFADIVSKDPKFDTTGGTILYKPITDEIGFKQGIPLNVFQMPSPIGNTIQQEIGVVPAATPPNIRMTVTPSQLGLPIGSIPLFTPDPPPVAISLNFGDSSVYKYLVFESGTMSMSITNNFPFAVRFVGNSIQLVNISDTIQTVANFTFSGQIASGVTATSNVVDLSNKKMDAGLKLKGTLQIVGWAGTTIQANNNLAAQLIISNAKIKSALAKTNDFDGQTVFSVTDSAVVLDDSIKVKFAKFTKGAMKIRIINTVPLRLTVQFKIDELVDNTTGLPYVLPGTSSTTGYTMIEPRDSLVATINMNQMMFLSRLRTLSNDTLVTQELHFSLGIKTLAASAKYELVNKTDFVIADVQPVESFELREVEGKIPPQSINIKQELDAGIGDIGNKLTLTAFASNISLSARVLSTGLFPTNLVLRVYALDGQGNKGQSVLVRNADDIANNRNYHRITPGVVDVIPVSATDINLLMNSFLVTKNELPSKFLLEGYALVSPMDVYLNPSSQFGIGTGGVKQTDSIFVSLDYAIPVAIGIQNGSLKDTASFSENNIDTAQVSSIESGKIFMNIENTFPVTLDVQMKLLKAQANNKDKVDTVSPPVLTLPQNLTDPVNYPPIKVAADTTANRTGVKSFTFVNLIPSDAAKLADASFAAVDLKMMTAGNGLVAQQFKKTDKIRIKTFANVVFNVDFDRLGK